MSNLPSTVKEKLNVFISKNDDGSIRGKLFYYGDFKIENVVKVYVLYKNGNIACEHYYKNKKHHGLAKGYYMNGQLAKQIYFQNGIAMYGSFFNKSGREFSMGKRQLKAREEF